MIIIASAAYIGHELAAEFGQNPPSMLPLGNKPLFEWQIKALREFFADERLVISLPQSYEISIGNIIKLSTLGIQVVTVPDEYSLAESLLFVVNTTADDSGVLRVLHGDTLINDLPAGDNVVAVAPTQSDYAWEVEKLDAQEEIVWSGFFSFSDPRLITKCLALSRGNFVSAIRSFDDQIHLERKYTNQWFDLGHINTYFASRARMTTERSFNFLRIEDGCVYKSSLNHQKIKAEINWYLNIPTKIKQRTPQLLEYGIADNIPGYTLEYLNLTPLNELYVHGRNPLFFWNHIFSHCDSFLKDCISAGTLSAISINTSLVETVSKDMNELITDKTWTRLTKFSEQTAIDLNSAWYLNGDQLPSLNEITTRCVSIALAHPPNPGVLHGDLCFSNILFDSRGDLIKLIDPRGINNSDQFTIFGDISYDLAKLTHSVVGLYDFIVAGMFKLERTNTNHLSFNIFSDNRISEIQKIFLDWPFLEGKMRPRNIIPHVILLFISMLPLHADSAERQLALMANALRLFAEFQDDL